jgi:small subunit ribosomal protein S5
MSDTPITPEETVLPQNPETSTETPVEASAEEATAPKSRDDRRGNDRRPRRGDRGGIREEAKEFQEVMLSIDRVTRVTAGGRQLRFRASIVIGDGKGRVGLGIGKSDEVQGSIEKAIRDAKKNLITFPIVNGSIPHDVAVNFKSSALFLHPAHAGTGIIAGGSVRKVFAVSGIKDVIAKQHGSPNPITNARVALKALAALKPNAMVKDFSKKSTDVSSEAPVKTEKKDAAPKKAPAKKK